jgi:hypothetical protein
MNTEIKLGHRIKDIVTGLTGIATARIEYLNGCVQFCVQPSCDKDGKRPEALYIDHQQLVFVDEGISIDGLGTGGPSGNAPTSYRG